MALCPQRHTPTLCPPTSCDRRMITTFGFFCCNKTQLNSVGICDTTVKMRRRLPGFQLEPSRWVGSDDYGYVAITSAKQHIGFCRFLGRPASPSQAVFEAILGRSHPAKHLSADAIISVRQHASLCKMFCQP